MTMPKATTRGRVTGTGFLADIIHPDDVSRDRLSSALQIAQPQALAWCDCFGSKVSRGALVDAMREALPSLLQIAWYEVRRRALSSPVQTASFRPRLDVFDGLRTALTLDFHVEIDVPRAGLAVQELPVVPVELRLSLGRTKQVQQFHEMRREIVLPYRAA